MSKQLSHMSERKWKIYPHYVILKMTKKKLDGASYQNAFSHFISVMNLNQLHTL